MHLSNEIHFLGACTIGLGIEICLLHRIQGSKLLVMSDGQVGFVSYFQGTVVVKFLVDGFVC